MFQFEKKVIDVILKCIKKHQAYLTQQENLPQLGKLGYMYNTLWYGGRICWGYNGIIKKSRGQCEDNPKYKIEMCDSINDEIDGLIYDAWGMHVSNEGMMATWETFNQNVYGGKTYSEVELLEHKPYKTFDDYVQMCTHKNYKYTSLYPNKRAVANYKLCVIGTGYEYLDGYITEKGVSETDRGLYSGWENVELHPDIKKVVDKIMSIPEVKETIEKSFEATEKWKQERESKRGLDYSSVINHYRLELSALQTQEERDGFYRDNKRSFELFNISTDGLGISEEVLNEVEEIPYEIYYPISEYSIITQLDEKAHPSYIKAGIEICEEIIEHQDEESPENVKKAEELLPKLKLLLKNEELV